jgi:hypothetical protein
MTQTDQTAMRPQPQPAHRPRSLKKSLNLGDVAAFLTGLVSFVEFPIVGRLFAPDIILLCIFIALVGKRGRSLTGIWPLRILLFATIWLASQIATDLVRDSLPEDYLRGWAKISFLIVNFAALYMFLRTDRRIVLYIVGFAASLIVRYYVDPNASMAGNGDGDVWKWVFGWPVTVGLVLAATAAYKNRKLLIAYGFLALASLLNLKFNYRSMALLTFATLCCLFLSHSKNSGSKRLRLGPVQLAAIVLSLAACGWGFGRLYEYAVTSGALGYDALQKYEAQSAGDGGVLLGGRSESLASLQAIRDSPFLGHGSWAKDAYYVELLKGSALEHGYKSPYTASDLIPTHSHILGAWVEAGFLGALFWFVALTLTLSGMKALLSYPLPLRVCSLFFGVLLIWDTLFSPFAQERRFTVPAFLLLMILAINRGRMYKNQDIPQEPRSRPRKPHQVGRPEALTVGT